VPFEALQIYFGLFDERSPHLKRTLFAFTELTSRKATPKITATASNPSPVDNNIHKTLCDTSAYLICIVEHIEASIVPTQELRVGVTTQGLPGRSYQDLQAVANSAARLGPEHRQISAKDPIVQR